VTNEEYKKWQKGATTTKVTSAKGGYDRDWKLARAAALLRDGYRCRVNNSENCTKDMPRPATEVDHKVPITFRRDLRLDPRDLQSSCLPCNRRKVHLDNTPEGQQRIKALSASMPPITGPIQF
jgi:5-methylcytosine-specific restriction endonuclease McrA